MRWQIGSTRVLLGDDFISLMTLAICCDGARVLTGAGADTTGSLKRFPLLDKRSRVPHDCSGASIKLSRGDGWNARRGITDMVLHRFM